MLCLCLVGTAHASHYLLSDVADVIPQTHHDALRNADIQNTAQLYERTVTRRARQALSERTSIEVALLTKWAQFLDLMQLTGVGPTMVRLLNAAEVDSLRTFRQQDASALHPRLRAANRGARYSQIVPSVDVLRGWIQAAQQVEPRLE